MMIELVWDKKFVKILKKWGKKHPNLIKKYEDRLTLFVDTPFEPTLKTHGLSGNLAGYWAFSITYEHRLVFKFLSEEKVLLIGVGTHDEVY